MLLTEDIEAGGAHSAVGFSPAMDVLLVDDHPILHETLRAVVASIAPDAHFYGETDLGAGVARARQIPDLRMVLLDLGLPGCSGIDALVRFLKVFPRARVVVVSATEDSTSVRAALNAGAVGYLPKTSPPNVIAQALSVVLGGGTYVPPQALGAVPQVKTPRTLLDLGITERQADVLRLVTKGLSNLEIARQLNIAENTVKQHAHAAYRALGVNSRTEAMVALAKMGISND